MVQTSIILQYDYDLCVFVNTYLSCYHIHSNVVVIFYIWHRQQLHYIR